MGRPVGLCERAGLRPYGGCATAWGRGLRKSGPHQVPPTGAGRKAVVRWWLGVLRGTGWWWGILVRRQELTVLGFGGLFRANPAERTA